MKFRMRSLMMACVGMTMPFGLEYSGVAAACTRFVYHGAHDEVITARSMDWKSDVGTNLWLFPRGMQRSGPAGPHSV
mgnify:CR=1 FL=1